MIHTDDIPKLSFQDYLLDDYPRNGRVADLCTIVDCEHKTAPYVDNSPYLVVRTSNLKSGLLIYEDMKYTTRAGYEEWTQRAIPTLGDVLFTREAPAGESCLVPEDTKVCLGQRMVLLRIQDKVLDSAYFSHYLLANRMTKNISRYSIGTTVSRINIFDIGKLPVYYPSLPEQQKIAAFLSAVDKKIQQLQRKKELLEQYKKGVMQKIFSQEIRFKDKEGSGYPDWEEKRLGEIITFFTTNSFSRKDLNYQVGTVKNIHYGDIHTTFKARLDANTEHIPFINEEIELNKIASESYCKIGDLVIADASEDYDDIGKSVEIWHAGEVPLVSGLHTFLGRDLSERTFVGFKGYLFQSQDVRRKIKVLAQGISVLGISKRNLENMTFMLPCMGEQQMIVNLLSRLDDKIEYIGESLIHFKQFKKGLLQQMFV